MRKYRGSALPVVELGAEKMPTKHGLKSKPVIKIIKWYGGDENGGGPKEVAPPSLKEEMDGDSIPF